MKSVFNSGLYSTLIDFLRDEICLFIYLAYFPINRI